MFKFVILVAASLAVASAGILPAAPALAYSSPVAYAPELALKSAALPVAYSAYSAPLAYSAPTIVKSYAAPAPLAYAASPVAYSAHPAPLAYAAAPIYKTHIY